MSEMDGYGKIVVDHILPELTDMLGPQSGVGGIEVKVSARSSCRSAGARGTAGHRHHRRGRRVHRLQGHRIRSPPVQGADRVRLQQAAHPRRGQGDQREARRDGFPIDIDLDFTDKDWHEVHSDKDDDTERRAGRHDTGDLRLTKAVVKKHAEAWALYNQAIDLMESYGAEYVFKGRIVMKYPMSISPAASSSYTNPAQGHVYIKEDQFNAYTLLHELAHKWEFDHCTGEMGMVWQLAKHGTTHNPRESTTYVPFLESFGDFWAMKVLQGISNGALKNFIQAAPYDRPDHPFHRDYIGGNLASRKRAEPLATLDYTERGWCGPLQRPHLCVSRSHRRRSVSSPTSTARTGTPSCRSSPRSAT
ncbi:MAG: hypothetical protein R2712_14560 [Vicinamibacterales bacterium]